jgi:YD repeat-containing protein
VSTVPADETYAYYASGQVQKYTGPDGTKVYTYDGRGVVARKSFPMRIRRESPKRTVGQDTPTDRPILR